MRINRVIAISVFVLAITSLLNPVVATAAYPKVKITNLTKWPAAGEVNYASALCRNDKYKVNPGETWVGPGRGVCLITWISASLTGGPQVTKYTSSGTSYSEFFVSPSNSDYQVFSSHESPTTNRAPQLAGKLFFNVGHMVNTVTAVDWAISKGANGLEVDMRFESNGKPSEFKHGAPCDCSCWTGSNDSVCATLIFEGGCSANVGIKDLLNHIAKRSSQVAMVVIDSKVDDLGSTAQAAAGAAVVQVLVDELLAKGYKGFALVSAPQWKFSPYLKAAVAKAKQSSYAKQIYVGVDQDNGGTEGARTTLNHLWQDAGTPQVLYGSGVSVCSPATYYAETMLSAWYTGQGRVRMTDIWTLDKPESMKEYVLLGARGVLTNKPGVLSKVAKDTGMTLAQPGYLP